MNLVDNPYTSLSGQDMVHTDRGRPHVEEAREQFSPHMEGVVGDQTDEDAITSSEGEQEVPNEQGPVVIYIRGARKHADNVDAFFRNNGRSIQRFQCDNAEMFTEAVNTDCTRMIVLMDQEFSQLMEDEDEFRMCKRAFSDLVGAEKEVQLVNYLDDDDEIVQEVKYTLPRAMRKNIIPYTRFLNCTNGYVALEDHVTSVAQVGDNNNIEVRLDGGNIRAQQVGRSNTFTASSGPSIKGYELTVKTPDTHYEVCVEIKKHIDDNIDNINISLKPHNASVESTSLGSVIIRVAVEPGTKLGPVWLKEVITKILSDDIIAKLPNGTRMEVNISASLPLTPLDVDIFEFEGENEAAHWMTEYTSDIHRKDETDRSMLHQAARIGNRAAVTINLKLGCPVNDQDCHGNTPLHYAVMSGETGASVSQLLVEGGASIEVVNSDGFTPLHLAVTERNLEMVELFARQLGAKESTPTADQKIEISSLIHFLVKQGADVNALNRKSLTPLQVAASSQGFDVIVALLTEGADANVVDENGQTPLHQVFGLNKPNQKIDEITVAYRLKKQMRVEPVTQSSGDTCKPDDNGASKAPSSVLDTPDNEGNTPLQSALNSNFIQAAIILLDAGANANTKNKEMDTPLHTVAGNPNIENTSTEHDAVVKIIECSRDVNVTDKQGNTSLMLAVEKNKNISPLLKAGADVNAQNIHGDTSLIMAVKHASRKMETLLEAGSEVCTSNTQLLLKAGADVNAQNIHGDTPLVIAVKHDSRMAHGANVNASNTHGGTDPHKAFSLYHSITNVDKMANTPSSTHVAKEVGLFLEAIPSSDDVSSEGETVYELVYTDDIQSSYKHSGVISEVGNVDSEVNFEDGNGNTPMTVAVRHGIVENVEALLKAGADVDAKDPMGRTPLMIAIETSQWISISNKKESNLITKLITRGADVNAEDPFGNTPLMMAVATGWDITLLLKAGADVNSKNGLCKTALHLVSEHLHPQYGHALVNARHMNTKLLIAAGADVNAQDEDGNTPLMMAVATGGDISRLLKAGADVNSKNGLGKTALHLISEHLHDRYKHTLINARHMNTKLLIAAGADVNAQDEDGNTPLMMAVATGWNISPLLKAGANVTSKNGLGKTALHLVSEHLHDRYKHAHISAKHRNTKLLIAAGADVNAQDEDGNTPLMMAVATGWNILPLLKARADVNLKNGLGKTALHLVSEHLHDRYGYAPIDERQSNIEQLIAAGADVNAQDEDDNTPLQICLKNNDYRSVKALLSVLRPDVNITNSIGKSALHLAGDAVSPTHFDIIGNFRKRCSFGLTEYSHEEPKEAIIRAILSRLPDINAQDHIDRTPLNIAKMLGDISLEEPLLSGGITSESEFGSSGARPFYSSTEKKKLKCKKRHKKTWKGRFEGNMDVH